MLVTGAVTFPQAASRSSTRRRAIDSAVRTSGHVTTSIAYPGRAIRCGVRPRCLSGVRPASPKAAPSVPRDVGASGFLAGTKPRRAGLRPFGIGETKPHHFLEIFRTAGENIPHPLFAWRILRDGVCDGCALGTTGVRDYTMDGVHLCTVRLNLPKLNTAGPMDTKRLQNVASLQRMSSRELRELGRLPYPMVRRRGAPGFHRVTWDEAL